MIDFVLYISIPFFFLYLLGGFIFEKFIIKLLDKWFN